MVVKMDPRILRELPLFIKRLDDLCTSGPSQCPPELVYAEAGSQLQRCQARVSCLLFQGAIS